MSCENMPMTDDVMGEECYGEKINRVKGQSDEVLSV